MVVMIPRSVGSKDLNEFIALLLGEGFKQDVCIDISKTEFIEIAPVLAMLVIFKSWIDSGKNVSIVLPEDGGGAFRYLQRMNFFSLCGVNLAERFIRGSEKASFVPLQEIDNGSSDTLASDMAECISPSLVEEFEFTDQPPKGDGYHSAITYALSELIRNVQQHSGGKGFAGAQKYKKSGRTQVTIADVGMGVRQSFIASCSPVALRINSDMDALYQAFTAQVSSKTHQVNTYGTEGHENSGVGLTLLRSIAEQSGGEYTLISGNAVKSSCGDSILSGDMSFKGTFAQFTFLTKSLDQFEYFLEKAKKDANIDGNDVHSSEIERLFQ